MAPDVYTYCKCPTYSQVTFFVITRCEKFIIMCAFHGNFFFSANNTRDRSYKTLFIGKKLVCTFVKYFLIEEEKHFGLSSFYCLLFPFHKRKSMFAVLHSGINSLKSGLLHLTGQPYCKNSWSAKVKNGITNSFLRIYLIDRYRKEDIPRLALNYGFRCSTYG